LEGKSLGNHDGNHEWDWRWKIENWDNFDKQPVEQPGDGESPRFGGYPWAFYLKELGK